MCLGARIEETVRFGRKGGAGPAGGHDFVIAEWYCVNIPILAQFTKNSPFTIRLESDHWKLYRGDVFQADVSPVSKPKFYDKCTSDGISMYKIALLHGQDCLGSTVYQRCTYWRMGQPCKFCGIELSLEYGRTIEFKTGKQLGEVAREAAAEGRVKHVTLTTGTPATVDKGANLLAQATKGIREAVDLPIHVQLEPCDRGSLKLLRDMGVDTVGINVESFDSEILGNMCPMKSSISECFKSLQYAVEVFGEGQVSSFVLVGLGESDQSILEGAKRMAQMGVVSFVVPFRPISGTPLGSWRPPRPERLIRVCREVGKIMREHRLDPRESRAGCVRCGSCTALPL
jgi:radical SAM protein (TIGR04043 family)